MKNFIKKQIRKYLKKHLDHSHPKHYYFLRWLADMVKDHKQLEDVCAGVAHWVYYSEECRGINQLQYLNDLIVIDNEVYIVTFRPGLWIGKMGKTVDSLKYSLNHNIDDEQIHDYRINFIELLNQPYARVMGYIHYYSDNW